jgi:hypothetical protein
MRQKCLIVLRKRVDEIAPGTTRENRGGVTLRFNFCMIAEADRMKRDVSCDLDCVFYLAGSPENREYLSKSGTALEQPNQPSDDS